MGLAFLPWEKIPPKILGFLLILYGSVLTFWVCDTPPFSWKHAAFSILIIVTGICILTYGIKNGIKGEIKKERASKLEE